MIGDTTNLTYSGQHSHHFSITYSTNNDAETPYAVIAALRIQNDLFENSVEELDTRMMYALSTDLTSSHPVLEEI